MNRLGAFARVPFLDGAVVLQPWVTTGPGAFGNLPQKGSSVFLLERLAGHDRARPPFFAIEGGLHEFVAHADGQVLVLVHHTAIGITIVRAVISLLDQGP